MMPGWNILVAQMDNIQANAGRNTLSTVMSRYVVPSRETIEEAIDIPYQRGKYNAIYELKSWIENILID